MHSSKRVWRELVPQVQLPRNSVLIPGGSQPLPCWLQKPHKTASKHPDVQVCRAPGTTTLIYSCPLAAGNGIIIIIIFPGKFPARRRIPRAGSLQHCLLLQRG